jgi:diguanylate cyclase (GGDEF)-like protein
MEKLRGALGSLVIETGRSGTVTVTVSVGIASLSELAPEARTVAALLDLADRRLYAAKHDGRNRVAGTG